jgi:hypoxanthine phosphoribosyltransferase
MISEINANHHLCYNELFSATQIQQRVMQLGSDISAQSPSPLYILGLLRGSFVFLADLIRKIKGDVQIEFLQVSSYQDAMNPVQEPVFTLPLGVFTNKHVLVVDDILDTGNTLAKVCQAILAQSPASVRTCVLLDKPARRQVPFTADWVGFAIEDAFVVGYGLDYQGYYRNLPFVAQVQI